MALNAQTLGEAAAALKAKDISPVELTQACLDRANAIQNKVNPFVVIIADRAMDAARRAESEIMAGDYRGPMHGIPVVVKDLCDIAGLPTTASSDVRFDHGASENAACVDRLNEAGAVIMAKTHTHEFAYGIVTPKTRNPWDPERIPGGSSGGTAASVAASLGPSMDWTSAP